MGKHGQVKPSGRPLGAPPVKPLIFDGNISPTNDSNKSLNPTVPPAPPAAPFVFDPDSKDSMYQTSFVKCFFVINGHFNHLVFFMKPHI